MLTVTIDRVRVGVDAMAQLSNTERRPRASAGYPHPGTALGSTGAPTELRDECCRRDA